MNTSKIIKKLNIKYPSRKIIQNKAENPSEIICEVDPTEEHPDHSTAIAVIDESIPHFHKATTEEYEIIQGKLTIIYDDKKITLSEGEKFVVKPNTVHSATGDETWVKVKSRPGWRLSDNILVKK